MIKRARHNFPRQYAAYENLKIILIIQYEIVFHLTGGAGTAPEKEGVQ